MQLLSALALLALPLASVAVPPQLASRTEPDAAQPTFPSSPPSCWLCQPHFAEINSCALASVVFQNISTVMLNPGRFLTTIQCACTDTFQSSYPQCADCFMNTNQTQFLGINMDGVPEVVQGVREICALASVLFGNAPSANGELVGQTPITVPSPTGGVGAAAELNLGATTLAGVAGVVSILLGLRIVWL
ncbi:hypothetical protein AURDEDRAFT_59144 [Auricularia subglabra TFB-10046 SS5]|nr:hypothetical protein AURDEDRAFT_59144 [Auricularia subglabra TFB-10046 SS5]